MNERYSRMYVDHVNKTTGRWANRDPARIVEVGDYGVIEHSSGIFEKEGNIFTEHLIEDTQQITLTCPWHINFMCSKSLAVREVSVAGKGYVCFQ
ncbi:hypothetical protein FA95DRAFT_1130827 [Auriscalpium vulgare]|uniref:Uncharacterized protein n=1 Tax=Auriscalpium vulgare TaxID=40419 RepID=A0ACB8RW65_9AGAM|nr:hypothetical protein FA95DRAFT_1130827 [Auriscalpium vulgare]